MRPSRAKTFDVRHDGKVVEAIPWQKLREWFGLRLLPAEAEVRADDEKHFVRSIEFEKLWKIAGRDFTIDDPSIGTASGKVPASHAIKKWLREELGWPGQVDGLNYYTADKLRRFLEEHVPGQRPPFDDPGWPECWGGQRECPAALARAEEERRREPVTDSQRGVLKFFGRSARTKGEASDVIGVILSNPENNERWEAEKARRGSSVAATEAQLIRLRFAAKRLRKRLPDSVSKTQASELVDEWYGDNPELEDDYQNHKEQLLLQEVEEMRREAAEDYALDWADCPPPTHTESSRQVSISAQSAVPVQSPSITPVPAPSSFGQLTVEQARKVRSQRDEALLKSRRRAKASEPKGCASILMVGLLISTVVAVGITFTI